MTENEFKPILAIQYHAALKMLRQTIELCPDDLWTEGDHARSFWRIVYHVLFYADFYIQLDEHSFTAWEKHRGDATNLWAVDDLASNIPYSKEDMLEYWDRCDAQVEAKLEAMNFDAETSGFPWYKMPKVEHQLVNLRHIQQHTGQLSERLMARGIDTDWVGGAPKAGMDQ